MRTSSLERLAGIDFGTSNSSVGLFRGERPSLLEFAGEGLTVPSAVFYSSESNETSFGRQAVASYTQGIEGRLLRSLKSVLGTGLMKEKTQIRNRKVAFADIMQDFFGFLRAQLEAERGASVDSVVLGRPVHFVDDDLQRDKEAETQLRQIAQQAGFRHIEFQFEPVAAALSYESTLTGEELAVIVDVGGGTADFSILRLSADRHALPDREADVLGNMGVHIGGTDFDRLLSLHSVMPSLGFGSRVKDSNRAQPGSLYHELATWHRIPLLYNPQSLNQIKQMRLDAVAADKLAALEYIVKHRLGHALARSVESAKITLSDELLAPISLSDRATRLVDCQATRNDMDTAIGKAVESLRTCVSEGLTQANVKGDDIVSVFYTGGSSGIPCLRAAFEDLLPQAQHISGDAFGSVGLGLTIDAARRFV